MSKKTSEYKTLLMDFLIGGLESIVLSEKLRDDEEFRDYLLGETQKLAKEKELLKGVERAVFSHECESLWEACGFTLDEAVILREDYDKFMEKKDTMDMLVYVEKCYNQILDGDEHLMRGLIISGIARFGELNKRMLDSIVITTMFRTMEMLDDREEISEKQLAFLQKLMDALKETHRLTREDVLKEIQADTIGVGEALALIPVLIKKDLGKMAKIELIRTVLTKMELIQTCEECGMCKDMEKEKPLTEEEEKALKEGLNLGAKV